MTVTVFEMGRLLPADEALEFGVEYSSVVVSGRPRRSRNRRRRTMPFVFSWRSTLPT